MNMSTEKKYRALVVDDDAMMRLLLRQTLEGCGFEVDEAEDGARALEQGAQARPDIVLLDVVMPGMDGFEVCKALRAMKDAERLPILMLTGLDDVSSIQHAYDAGATDFITKPINWLILAHRVRYVLRAHKAFEDLVQSEECVHFLSCYDSITGLANRMLFKERIGSQIRLNHRYERAAAVLLIDIDNFKRINDTYGHSIGDRLLYAIGDRIKTLIRDSDTLGTRLNDDAGFEVARMGGDEFAILLAEITRTDDAARVAKRLLDALNAPFIIGGVETFVTASVGIAAYPSDGESVDDLLKNADSALFYAKDLGRNNYQFYSPSMNARALERMTMESSLRKALERGEFVLHYQPKVDLRTGSIDGVEALIRWRHPDLGLIPPAQFIPIAEATGLIVPMDEWTLGEATRQAAAWQRAGLGPIAVAVNMSGLGFRQANLIETVSRALTDSGLAPEFLEMELTETIVMENVDRTLATLKRLAEMGIHLSVDDFGTGYSSLSYLKRFPLSVLKVDRSFVKDVTTDADDASIVTAVIRLAHSLKLKVVAEGVETAAHLAFLQECGCDIGQGYYFSRPECADRIEEMLRNGRCISAANVIPWSGRNSTQRMSA